MFVKKYPHLFKLNLEHNPRSIRHTNKLFIPKCNVKLFQKNIYFMAIKIFNKIPNNIKELPITKFKTKLTTWLLDKCFYDINEFFLNKN